MENLSKHSKAHVVDIITDYFSNLDVNTSNFTIKTWKSITKDLLTLINVSPEKIKEMKEKHQSIVFKDGYYNDFLVNYSNRSEEDRTLIENNNISSCYLNTAFAEALIKSNKVEFNLLYPKIFSSLWMNGIVEFNNENFGVIIYNIVQHYHSMSNTLVPLEKHLALQIYLKYVYGILHKGELDIKHQDLVKIDGVEYNDVIRAYAYYMYSKIRKYIGDYMVYYDTDIFYYSDSNESHLEIDRILSFIVNTFGIEFEPEWYLNLDCLFLKRRKYLYITQRGELKCVGIKRIDVNDKQNFVKMIRKAKIHEVFE